MSQSNPGFRQRFTLIRATLAITIGTIASTTVLLTDPIIPQFAVIIVVCCTAAVAAAARGATASAEWQPTWHRVYGLLLAISVSILGSFAGWTVAMLLFVALAYLAIRLWSRAQSCGHRAACALGALVISPCLGWFVARADERPMEGAASAALAIGTMAILALLRRHFGRRDAEPLSASEES